MKSSPVPAEKSAPPSGPLMASPTVLIADDEMLVRWSLKQRLALEGYRVLEASTAAEALRHASDPVDVIVLDYRLPDATGLAVLHTVKVLHPATQVVLMTAFSSLETAADAIALGAFNYVAKPFDLDTVAGMVADAVAARRLFQE